MLKNFNLAELCPMSEVEKGIEKNRQWSLDYWTKQVATEAQEKLAKASSVRQALAKLDTCGIDLECGWVTDAMVEINIGKISRRLSDRRRLSQTLLAIRNVLECPMTVANKTIDDDNVGYVKVRLEPRDFPAVRIKYSTKLAKKAKCRIVVQRVKTLVCSTD